MESTDINEQESDVKDNFKTSETKTFELNYNFGVTEEKIDNVSFTYFNFRKSVFPIPIREHFTFNGWYIDETQITDANGAMVIGEELLRNKATTITAKWTANETFTYKILLVYVTRIQASLPTRDQQAIVTVNYAMNELHREFCQLTTKRLKSVMDDMLDGLVNFQIDEYYTVNPVLTENFNQSNFEEGQIRNILFPNQIPEVANLLENYDSIVSVFCLNDPDFQLIDADGLAQKKYCEVHLDALLDALRIYGFTIVDAVNLIEQRQDIHLWGTHYLLADYWFDTFLHEIAHTIELRINGDDYHGIVVDELMGRQLLGSIKANKYYYLHEADFYGKKCGIPYAFWKGDIAKATYQQKHSGYVSSPGATFERLPKGGWRISWEVVRGHDVPSVTATAFSGCRFIGWSDGITTATRTDRNVTHDMTVIALFEKVK